MHLNFLSEYVLVILFPGRSTLWVFLLEPPILRLLLKPRMGKCLRVKVAAKVSLRSGDAPLSGVLDPSVLGASLVLQCLWTDDLHVLSCFLPIVLCENFGLPKTTHFHLIGLFINLSYFIFLTICSLYFK